jgi:hypothetical protein
MNCVLSIAQLLWLNNKSEINENTKVKLNLE